MHCEDKTYNINSTRYYGSLHGDYFLGLGQVINVHIRNLVITTSSVDFPLLVTKQTHFVYILVQIS